MTVSLHLAYTNHEVLVVFKIFAVNLLYLATYPKHGNRSRERALVIEINRSVKPGSSNSA